MKFVMARRGKVKYRDVVGKVKGHIPNKSSKRQSTRKTYSIYKTEKLKKISKRKPYKYRSQPVDAKGPKLESNDHEDESLSEEESDDFYNLLNTFSSNENNQKSQAIDSSSESEMSEEHKYIDNRKLTEDLRFKEECGHKIGIDSSTSELDSDEENSSSDECQVDEKCNDENNEIFDDPFIKHIQYELHESVLDTLQTKPILTNNYSESWPELGNIFIYIPKSNKISATQEFSILEQKKYAPEGVIPKSISRFCEPCDLYIKPQIIENLKKVNKSATGSDTFTTLQAELFSIMNNYQDLYFSGRTISNSEEIRYTYCLHAVNHILKTRSKVIHHNARLSKKDDVPEDFRDQGLVRPKILFIIPFKHSAYKIIKMIIDLILPDDKGNVMNKKRFIEDYTGNELSLPKKNPKPEDYELTFQGNTSDDFKIGITVTKKSLKLYSDFYSSDIIVASPLGLRTIIGAEGEPDRDYDFLASIELLILDQAEIILMQNWDHLLHTLNHLHLQPKSSHGTDFSRVRIWSLNGLAKYYRQTLIISSHVLPEINSIFNKKCLNYAGKVKVLNPIEFGCISQVVVQIPHVFHKFNCQNAANTTSVRFDFFINKILPQQRASLMKQTLIFIPSYFDYVRVRNYFKREDIGFVQICEYSKEGKVARARDIFYHGDTHFLLYTERFHFFNRKRIKGIRHLLFYQLPVFPHFYYEMCNLMQEGNQNRKLGNNTNMSVTVIYSKYDIHQLASIVGTEKAGKMIQSERKVHMMVTGADKTAV